MQCPIQERENASVLLEYCDRKLDPELMAQLSRHVGRCAACQRALAGQRLVWDALDAWEAEPVSPDFNRRLYRRIEHDETRGWWQDWLRPLSPVGWRPAVPVAAACLVLVAALLLRLPSEADFEKQVTVESIDVEQVERTLDDLEMLRQFSPMVRVEPPVKRAL